MESDNRRKEPPTVAINEDIDPQDNTENTNKPPAITYEQKADYSKLKFGQYLILGCLTAVIILTTLTYLQTPADDTAANTISAALEFFKLITTTALGFVFAKTQTKHQ